MSDNKKYYYLKLKDNFFDSSEVIALESLPDGMMYVNILLKLYLRSLNRGGCLMLTDRIPYNTSVLAKVVRHPEGVVKEALKVFQELGMIEILETGEMYMLDIQNFIGESSTEADRIREYRSKITAKQQGLITNVVTDDVTNVQQKNTIIRDRDRDRDRDKVKDRDRIKDIKKEYAAHIHMTEENHNQLLKLAQGNDTFLDEIIYDCNEWRKEHKPKSKNPNDYMFVKNWLKKELEKVPLKPKQEEQPVMTIEEKRKAYLDSLPPEIKANLDQFK